MSNLIKSRYVLSDTSKKYIDTNELSERLRVIQFERVNLQNEAAITIDPTLEEEDDGEFVQGLGVTVVETASERMSTELYEEVIANAHVEANQIIEKAKLDGVAISKQLQEEAKNIGYKEGMELAQSEIELEMNKLKELEASLQHSFEQEVAGLESKFAHLVVKYVEKLTGICVDDNKNMIVTMLHNSIMSLEPTKSIDIKVSREDYDIVLSRKEEFQTYVGNDTLIEVRLDNELIKNQCLIETDSSIIDCSLDVKLNSLVRDIKLLATQTTID